MDYGCLYIVATPLGNMSDITIRAIETLKTVDYIISEDTRETDKLLKRYEIKKPQISYRDQVHAEVCLKILDILKQGKNMALVSDSGTPLVSDPGYKLVRDLIKAGINIVSIPGPSAVISCLVVSGLPTDKFVFLGFLPKSSKQRKEVLKNYGVYDATLTIYESPYRIARLLADILESLGNRAVCIIGEQTKVHEKIFRGNVEDLIVLLDGKKLKGEFVVLVGKRSFKYD